MFLCKLICRKIVFTEPLRDEKKGEADRVVMRGNTPLRAYALREEKKKKKKTFTR